jgi:hypothetical protein
MNTSQCLVCPARFMLSPNDHDYAEVNKLLVENTDLTRSIHQLTVDVHHHLCRAAARSDVAAFFGKFEANPSHRHSKPVGEQPVDQDRGCGRTHWHAQGGQPGHQGGLQGAQATWNRGCAGHKVAAQVDSPYLHEGELAAQGVYA